MIVLKLAHFQIAWQTQVAKNALMRYKLFLLFTLLILSSSLTSLQKLISFPAHMSFGISLMLFQGLGLIWLIVYQSFENKKTWNDYFLSLPLSKKQRISCDILSLFIWDLLLWLPLLVAAASHPEPGFVVFIKSMITIAFVLLTQLAVKHAKPSVSMLRPLFHLFNLAAFTPFAKIQVANLYLYYQARLILLIFCVVGLLFIAFGFLHYHNDTSHVLFIASLFSLVNAFILSHLFVLLHNERLTYFSYLNTLPLKSTSFFIEDMVLVSAFLVVCNLPFLFVTNFAVNTLLVMPTLFLMFSYYPQIMLKKYGLFAALFLMISFIYLNYFFIFYYP